MTFPSSKPWRPREMLALLFVLLLHLGAWVALRHSLNAPGRGEATRQPARVNLRLLPMPVAPSPRTALLPPRANTPREQAAITPRRPADAPPPDTSAAAGITAPAEATPVAGPPELPASQPPRALDLALPRGYATQPGTHNAAVDDPRANTARLTPEARMARRFDTQVTEEVIDNGRRRFRQGDKCVIVTPSRTTQLMPFSESAARIPSMVSACP